MRLTIITGASGGIGAELAAEAERAGDTLATISRRPGPGQQHLATDLSDPARWPEVLQWIDALIGARPWTSIVAIHNAATIDPIGFAGTTDPVALRANVILNSAAPQVVGDGVLRSMESRKLPGAVVMISSGAGQHPFTGWSTYCAGKAAMDMWTRTAGLERADRSSGVSIVAIGPGVVATDMQAAIRATDEAAFPDVERFRQMADDGALRDPADVAAAIYGFAISERLTEIDNGSVIGIDDL